MSTKYTGGFITKSPVAPTSSAASGIWTLDQQQQAQKAGTWPSPPIFIEDIFSTYLYTGTGTTNNIVNGIDLSGKGGLVWTKARSTTSAFTFAHALMDTVRGAGIQICSDRTDANTTQADSLTAFNSNGYTLGADTGQGRVNNTSYGTQTYVGWTFAKQSKFFDIVTFTGDGAAGQTINHSLGATPGFMVVKRINTTGDWAAYHRSLGATQIIFLNDTQAAGATVQAWNDTAPTSTQFTVGVGYNASGSTYVAYLFAHDAGGFPVSGGGSTNGISCGTFTTDGAGAASVTLGYEPQWIMTKRSAAAGSWQMYDVMRGMPVGSAAQRIDANLANPESTGVTMSPTSTGFSVAATSASSAFIYIAIRRGPMKTPTTATSVFIPFQGNGNGGVGETFTTNFPVDLSVDEAFPPSTNYGATWTDRLRGTNASYAPILNSSATYSGAENNQAPTYYFGMDSNTTLFNKNYASLGKFVNWAFRRAPGFFDIVCYTGTGVARTLTHNLGVVPELMIVKRRDASSIWAVYAAPLANAATSYLNLSDSNAVATGNTVLWNSTAPTSTVFTIGSSSNINTNGSTNVAYLFATVAGVSKVGTYTGTGAVQTINCGFSGGARFVLVKRTDSAGDWNVYDTARGMVTGNDNFLTWNTTAAQSTVNSLTTASTGFQLTAENFVDINTNGGTYIFLAIA
jgi:hypothetical protein